MKSALANALLAVGVIVVGVSAMEGAVRVLDRAEAEKAAGKAPEGHGQGGVPLYEVLSQRRVFERHVPEIPGLRREWFYDDPPPVTPKPTSPELEEQQRRNAAKVGHPPNAWKLYNVKFFKDYYCNDRKGWIFPDTVYFYGPPDSSAQPFYRFPTNVATPSGLVANRYGWKGEDIEPDKPPGTIRIAFLGASTTISYHGVRAYPSYIGHWLNLWARAKDLPVRFETINTGHETYKSMDMAAVVKKELLPLEPDLVVYYEGANQFKVREHLIGMPWARIPPSAGSDLTNTGIFTHSALLRRARLVWSLFAETGQSGYGLKEPEKPAYARLWPRGLNMTSPDISRTDLPVDLSVILRDLRAIKRDLGTISAELVPSSFIWMVYDGMVLDPIRHAAFHDYTNRELWPLTYADARRLADFQNAVLRKFAAEEGLPFIDIAETFPRELSLFTDTIHMTALGLRLRAWLTLERLLPVIERKIESSELPRLDREKMTHHPVLDQTVRKFPLDDLECVETRSEPTGFRVRVKSLGTWLSDPMARRAGPEGASVRP